MKKEQSIWTWILSFIAAVALFAGIEIARQKAISDTIKDMGNNMEKMSEDVQAKAIEQQKKYQYEQWASQKVMIFVKARDTRTCMKILGTTVIDASIVECNKDHYVEMRNDEVEAFKQQQGITN